MIYEPTFNAEITLEGESAYSTYQIREYINDIECEMQEIEREISMYCCADIKNILPTDFEGEPIFFVKNKISELMQEYARFSIKCYQMRLYLDSEPDIT